MQIGGDRVYLPAQHAKGVKNHAFPDQTTLQQPPYHYHFTHASDENTIKCPHSSDSRARYQILLKSRRASTHSLPSPQIPPTAAANRTPRSQPSPRTTKISPQLQKSKKLPRTFPFFFFFLRARRGAFCILIVSRAPQRDFPLIEPRAVHAAI